MRPSTFFLSVFSLLMFARTMNSMSFVSKQLKKKEREEERKERKEIKKQFHEIKFQEFSP